MNIDIKRAVTCTRMISIWIYFFLIPSLFLLPSNPVWPGLGFAERMGSATLGAFLIPIVCGVLFQLYLRLALPEVAKAWRGYAKGPHTLIEERLEQVIEGGWMSVLALAAGFSLVAWSSGVCFLFYRFGVASGWPYFAWFIQVVVLSALVFVVASSTQQIVAQGSTADA